MSVNLKRLYLENYKLFDSKEILFEGHLSVFDGPNGYGKTSVFDALEFLITGKISRVSNDLSISGSLAYSSNFLAKDPRKDVLLKGEFCNEENGEILIIALKIPASPGRSRSNNPKQIFSCTETYLLPKYDTPPEIWNQPVSIEKITAIRCAFFGAQNLEHFSLFHYIQQEDRLSYFKCPEADRTKQIADLFGIQEYILKQEKVNQAYTQLKKKLKSLESDIVARSNDLNSIPKDAANPIPYVPLTNGKAPWDLETFPFQGIQSKDLFETLKANVAGTKKLYAFFDEFQTAECLSVFFSIPERLRGSALLAWKVQQEKLDSVDALQKKQNDQRYLNQQKEQLDNHQFQHIQWQEFCTKLGLSEYAQPLTELTTQVIQAAQNQTSLQKSIAELNQYRTRLHQASLKLDLSDNSHCPYCGQDWGNIDTLEAQFKQTKAKLDNAFKGGETLYSSLLESLTSLYSKHCSPVLDAALTELNQDIVLQIFNLFPNWQSFKNYGESCIGILHLLNIYPNDLRIENNLDKSLVNTTSILERIAEANQALSAEYHSADREFNFHRLFHDCFDTPLQLKKLSLEMLEQKETYITQSYYKSFTSTRLELERLKKQKNSLNALCEQIGKYKDSLQQAIKDYQQHMITEIEIPFFLYSSRLLQSYQGGQGILINSNGNTVRFVAPGSEHDVLYTMSSGQLSAVLLAFSLSLNKIYAGENFKTILIDDPIQCMDDINMTSFVELLIREFNDTQIILSTHEDSFANFIQYKFNKYDIPQEAITLKNT